MSKFDHYFLMQEQDALEYVQEKYSFFPRNASLVCKEIGDGNLNYVFRITDTETGNSVILKHSGRETRSRSGRVLDVDRNRIEAEILQLQDQLAPGYVPKVLGYDTKMCCCAMEDLKEYTIMRTGLMEYQIFPEFANHITNFLVDTLLPTSDVVMDHKTKKHLAQKYTNPDLCSITEQLVYDDAVGNFSEKNSVPALLKDFVETEIYHDCTLRLEVSKLKFNFMEHSQALLHGDLHSGSIFVTQEKTRVFDPEFAFYGPMGYDIGNVIAHLIFGYAHAEATLNDDDFRRKKFCQWIVDTVIDIVSGFREKFAAKYEALVTDHLAKTEGFCNYYLSNVMADAAGSAGLEIIRRIVGVAKVKDITAIPDEQRQTDVEKKLLLLGKRLILYRDRILTKKDWLAVLERSL